MRHYVADLAHGDEPIAPKLEAFHRMAERVLGPGYDFTFQRFPNKAHTWQLYAELDKPERRGNLTSVSFDEVAFLEVPAIPAELLALERHTKAAMADMLTLGTGLLLDGKHLPQEAVRRNLCYGCGRVEAPAGETSPYYCGGCAEWDEYTMLGPEPCDEEL